MRIGHGKCVALVLTVAVLALPGVASASVFDGHSGWFWADPLPQGNTLRAIEFTGQRGYAAGDFGTLLRSDDAGTTWIGVTTGTTVPLSVVRALPPDTVVVGGRCTVLRSDDAGRTFQRLPWTPAGNGCRAQLRSLAFPTSFVGYLVLADGTVLRSADGGGTWSARTAIPGTKVTNPQSQVHPTDIYFTTADTGFAVTDSGTLFRTTDGGTSWSVAATAPQHLDSIFFPDATTGYAVGGASVLTTTDGGITWVQQGVVVPPESLDWIRCADQLRCTATTRQGDVLMRTDDGGKSWAAISPASRPLFAAAYSQSGSLVAVGQAGTTVASADGGHNFATISGSLGPAFRRVRTTSPLVAYALGRAGALARTVDGGEHWSLLAPPLAGNLLDASFATVDRGYVLDNGGTLLRTDNGGASWRLLDIGTYLAPRALVAVSLKNLLLVGPRGVRHSVDGGQSFFRVRQRAVASAALTAGGRVASFVFAYGPHALVLSPDAGALWVSANVPGHGPTIVALDFVTVTDAYALTRDGRLWKTVDGANTWTELASLGTEVGTDLAFSDPDNGYVAVSDFGADSAGYVMRTSDGGITWRPQLVDSKQLLPGGLAAPTANTAYAIAGGGHLLATQRGGDTGKHSALSLAVHRRRPGRPGVISIVGTLTPAQGGETVVISRREGKSSRWLFRSATVSSSGHFTVFSRVTKTSRFVAQWSGDADHVGAGSPVVTVGVGKKFIRPSP